MEDLGRPDLVVEPLPDQAPSPESGDALRKPSSGPTARAAKSQKVCFPFIAFHPVVSHCHEIVVILATKAVVALVVLDEWDSSYRFSKGCGHCVSPASYLPSIDWCNDPLTRSLLKDAANPSLG